MSQTIIASNITLEQLETKFNLKESNDLNFFPEWQHNLPELDDWEKRALDRLKIGCLDVFKKTLVLENKVRMCLLYPLFFIAGFYISPLQVKSEQPILIEDKQGNFIEGRIDILILKNQFWCLVIESKRPSISVEEGLPQILTYMMGNIENHQPVFGLITNGMYLMFVKLVKSDIYEYGLSDIFVMRNQNNQLYQVLQIMKKVVQ